MKLWKKKVPPPLCFLRAIFHDWPFLSTSSINLWKIFTINDTSTSRLSSNSRPVCGIFVASKSCDFIFSILDSCIHGSFLLKNLCSINQKKQWLDETRLTTNKLLSITTAALPFYRVLLLTIWYLSNNPVNQSTILSWKQCRRSVNEKPITVPKWCMQLTTGKLFPILIRYRSLQQSILSSLFHSHRCIYISLKLILQNPFFSPSFERRIWPQNQRM